MIMISKEDLVLASDIFVFLTTLMTTLIRASLSKIIIHPELFVTLKFIFTMINMVS